MKCVAGVLGSIVWLIGLPAGAAAAEGDTQAEEPAPPWELSALEPGEPQWAPLLKLRGAEDVYRDTRWWNAYNQILAQAEASAGNHAAALRAWDGGRGGPDSVAVLPEGARAVDALTYLGNMADTAQVVMINERHHAGSDRLLTLELLPVLRDEGFRYFAAEAFNFRDSTLSERGYPIAETGTYTSENVFAEVVREALRLGYTLVPYEATNEQLAVEDELTRQQRRDRTQAKNLHDRIFRDDPDAKVFVHAGYSHVLEVATERWYPMALYFREMSGIDPLTVDQTRLSERSSPEYEHPMYRAAVEAGLLDSDAIVLLDSGGTPIAPADFAVDVQVFTPRSRYREGRPTWMTLGGRRVADIVELPECEDRTCFVEARGVGALEDALPLDRAEAGESGRVRLYLPPGAMVEVQIFAEDGEVLRSEERVVEAEG